MNDEVLTEQQVVNAFGIAMDDWISIKEQLELDNQYETFLQMNGGEGNGKTDGHRDTETTG